MIPIETLYAFLEAYRDERPIPYIYAGQETPANFLEDARNIDLISDIVHGGHSVKWKETRVAGVEAYDEALVTKSCEVTERVTTRALTGLCVTEVATIDYLQHTAESLDVAVDYEENAIIMTTKTIGTMDCPAITTTPQPPPPSASPVPCYMEVTAKYTITGGHWMRYRTEKITYPMPTRSLTITQRPLT